MRAKELAAALFENGGAGPTRDIPLNQGFLRDLAVMRRAAPDSRVWPPELDEFPLDARGRFRIDRRHVFAIAERAIHTPEDRWASAQLHCAIVIWGAPPGRDMTRAFRPLADAAAPEHLTQALKVVRGEGPISAYCALSKTGGRLHVSGLGPSFFTKFLYFGGWDAKHLLDQPLIMDKRVVKSLKALTKESWTNDNIDDYRRFLELARDVAHAAETTEDVVEWRLWQPSEDELDDSVEAVR